VTAEKLRPYRPLLIVLAVFCVLRLLAFAWQYSRQSLQMDFSAFYQAAASLNAGHNPYHNNVDVDPKLWDGAARFQHSRYLYPPIVAAVLRPLARLPYPAAKTLWTFASLAAVAASVVIAAKIARARWSIDEWLVVIIASSLLFPLLPMLERGQIDGWTMLFIYLGFHFIFARRRDMAGGAVMAIACVIKLQCVFLLPLLLIARRRSAAMGLAAGLVVLLATQVLLCGWSLTKQYVSNELPRISRYGEKGSDEMRLDPAIIRSIDGGLPEGDVLIARRWRYRYSLLPKYAQMASLTPFVGGVLKPLGIRTSMSIISIALLAVMCGAMWRSLRDGIGQTLGPIAFVNTCLLIILLSSPITWTTNLVWLAPIGLIILFPRHEGALATAAIVGFLLLIIPDAISNDVFLPKPLDLASARGKLADALLGAQYVLAMLLMLPYVLRRVGWGAHE
jgi:hypothetical protein